MVVPSRIATYENEDSATWRYQDFFLLSLLVSWSSSFFLSLLISLIDDADDEEDEETNGQAQLTLPMLNFLMSNSAANLTDRHCDESTSDSDEDPASVSIISVNTCQFRTHFWDHVVLVFLSLFPLFVFNFNWISDQCPLARRTTLERAARVT